MIQNQENIEQQLRQQFATSKNPEDARKALIMLAALKSGDDKNNSLLLKMMPYIRFDENGIAVPLNGVDDLSGKKRKAKKTDEQVPNATRQPFGERFTKALDSVNNFTSNLQLPKVRVEVDANKITGAASNWLSQTLKENGKKIAIGAGISIVAIGGIIYFTKSGNKKK